MSLAGIARSGQRAPRSTRSVVLPRSMSRRLSCAFRRHDNQVHIEFCPGRQNPFHRIAFAE
jgi:hypothetical protein